MPPETLDVILLHHVLEHLLEPASLLSRAHQWLKPGGRLLVYVPFEKEKRYRQFNPAEPNHHLYSWNTQTLANLITDCQFTIETARVRMFSYDRFSSVAACRLHLGQPGYRLIRRLVHTLYPCLEVEVIASRDRSR